MHRPDSYYGLSKAFGEDLGRLYADKHGLSAICIRIGSCEPRPADARHLSTWISERDLVQLVCIGIEAPNLHFSVVYGISGNDRAWWDNTTAYEMGYKPEDNSETYAAEILSRDKSEDVDEIARQFQGGDLASVDFDGNPVDIS
jgi:uronate dehydrogenase